MAKITLAPGVTKDDFISDKFVIYERNGQHYIRLKSKKKERSDEEGLADLPSYIVKIIESPRKKVKKKE